ncbi:MAG: hypothetical protein ACOX2N_04500 [Peptococcia bacterium]|jgi:hypothetical protein
MSNNIGVVSASNVIEMDEERKLNQAAGELSDEIWDIKDNLEKACLLLQEMLEEYFEKYDKGNEEDRFCICHDYSRYGIFAEMVADYAFDAKENVKALKARVDQYCTSQH